MRARQVTESKGRKNIYFKLKNYFLLSTNFKLLRQSGYSINVIFKFLNFCYGQSLQLIDPGFKNQPTPLNVGVHLHAMVALLLQKAV
jgi:hypothetical protein